MIIRAKLSIVSYAAFQVFWVLQRREGKWYKVCFMAWIACMMIVASKQLKAHMGKAGYWWIGRA